MRRSPAPVYRIGTFAHLAGLSVKALRYYDATGLLKPSRVDPRSGYRWYAAAQLADAHRLIAARDLGIRLDSKSDGLGSRERVRIALRERIEHDTRTLLLLEAASDGDDPSVLDIVVKRVGAAAVVCVRDRLRASGEVDELLRELRASVPKSVAAGRFGALWHGCEDDASFDCEALMFVDRPVQPTGRSTFRVLAAGQCAAILCDGDEDDRPYYAALRRWLFAHGRALGSATREIYHSAEPRSNDALTEIQFPLAAAAPVSDDS